MPGSEVSPGADRTCDVAIMGGGFNGAATALLLRRANPRLNVLIVEKRRAFDRKVGESAIELSSWFLTQVLGLNRHLAVDQLPKYGQRYWFHNDRVGSLAEASELGNLYQTRVPSFHIDRAVLDEHVLGLAVAEGATLIRPGAVTSLDLREGGHSTLVVESADGRATVRARWVIDATGRKALLARRLGLLSPMPEHPIHAVWARYSGVRDFDGDWLRGRDGAARAPVSSRGLSTNHLTGPGWWIWAIPLAGGDVSVGVVWDERLLGLPPGDTLAQRFDAFLRITPACREMIEGATMHAHDLHALNNLPYSVSRLMGDGWAMVGDAAGFLDPFYSPGLDWGSITIAGVAGVVGRALGAGAEDPAAIRIAIERHNRTLTTGFRRWFEAIYRDKYFYIGDADLMEIALRMDVSLYYFGVVTPPYRDGIPGLYPPFALPVSLPFYHLMRFVNRRLARLARIRLASGRYGRANAGRQVLLPGFKLGYSSLRWLPGILARLAVIEAGALSDRILARRFAVKAEEVEMAGTPAPR